MGGVWTKGTLLQHQKRSFRTTIVCYEWSLVVLATLQTERQVAEGLVSTYVGYCAGTRVSWEVDVYSEPSHPETKGRRRRGTFHPTRDSQWRDKLRKILI